MQDFLQLLDLEYYRSALLHVARDELERLRQGRSAGADVETRGKTPFGASSTSERATSPEVACAVPPGAVRDE
jgi:hypothetical protein